MIAKDEVFAGLRGDPLVEFAERVGATTTVAQLAAAIAEHAELPAKADFANLALVDSARAVLEVQHSTSLPSDISAPFRQIPLGLSTPLTDAARTGQPVFVHDYDELTERYPDLVEVTVEAGLPSSASVPLFRNDGSVSGVLGLGWRERQPFSVLDQAALRVFAALCERAIERVEASSRSGDVVRIGDRAPSSGGEDPVIDPVAIVRLVAEVGFDATRHLVALALLAVSDEAGALRSVTDPAQLARSAHRLRSTALTVGALRLADALEPLETDASSALRCRAASEAARCEAHLADLLERGFGADGSTAGS